MTKESGNKAFLERAREAEEQAAKAETQEGRDARLKIDESYRALAESP